MVEVAKQRNAFEVKLVSLVMNIISVVKKKVEVAKQRNALEVKLVSLVMNIISEEKIIGRSKP